MKRLLKMLTTLFTIYLLIQLAFKFWGNGHEIKYQVKVDNRVFNVEEIYVANTKNEIDSYYFNVLHDNDVFSFQTYAYFKKDEMIIENIKYFENDDYKCLLPIFENKTIIMDIMCLSVDGINYYNNIKGRNSELDRFVSDLSDYDLIKWEDDKTLEHKNGPLTIYTKNLIDDHFVGINNYRGIYTLSNSNENKIFNVQIFKKDVYIRDLEVMLNQHYVVADYNSQHEFSDFFIINLANNVKKTIKSNKKISFDSYIQGVVKNSVYLYDQSNKKQYELNIKSGDLLEVGNVETGIKYYNNGKWERVDVGKFLNKKILFPNGEENSSNSSYSKIDTVGLEETGYIYYYRKVSNGYNVYRAPSRNAEQKIYLFNIKSLKNIKYVHDFVYFLEGDEVKYYSDNFGVRTLFKNTEFKFNKSLKYSVYIKK